MTELEVEARIIITSAAKKNYSTLNCVFTCPPFYIITAASSSPSAANHFLLFTMLWRHIYISPSRLASFATCFCCPCQKIRPRRVQSEWQKSPMRLHTTLRAFKMDHNLRCVCLVAFKGFLYQNNPSSKHVLYMCHVVLTCKKFEKLCRRQKKVALQIVIGLLVESENLFLSYTPLLNTCSLILYQYGRNSTTRFQLSDIQTYLRK